MFKFLVLQQPEVNGKEDVEVCSTKSLMDIFFAMPPGSKMSPTQKHAGSTAIKVGPVLCNIIRYLETSAMIIYKAVDSRDKKCIYIVENVL